VHIAEDMFSNAISSGGGTGKTGVNGGMLIDLFIVAAEDDNQLCLEPFLTENPNQWNEGWVTSGSERHMRS